MASDTTPKGTEMQTVYRETVTATQNVVVVTDGTSVAFGVETDGTVSIRGYVGSALMGTDKAIAAATDEAQRIARAIRFDGR